jgi:copper transporter 1
MCVPATSMSGTFQPYCFQAYLITAVVLGAAIGHYVFGSTIDIDALVAADGKGMSCH